MKKYLLILLTLTTITGVLSAQTPPMKGFSSGASTGEVDAVLGYPMLVLKPATGIKLSPGLPFSELVIVDEGTKTVMGGTTYSDDYFTFDPVRNTDAGQHRKYFKYYAPKNYHLIASLFLIVDPCGEDLTMSLGGYEYPTVPVAGYCWTKENLKYNDGTDGSMESGPADTYGMLYKWESATSLCPSGWHLPTATEMEALRDIDDYDLNAVSPLWLAPMPSPNTDLTGFSALPAGRYNSATARFEDLGLKAYWWSYGADGTTPDATESVYYCDSPLPVTVNPGDALSVRCVKD